MKTWSLGNNQPVCFSVKDNQAEYRKKQNLNHKVFPPKDTKGFILQGSGNFICQMEWKVERMSSSATSDFYIRVDNSIILSGTVMVNPPCLLSSSSSDQSGDGDWVHYKLCICAFSFLQSTNNRPQHGRPGLRRPLKKYSLDDLSPGANMFKSQLDLFF